MTESNTEWFSEICSMCFNSPNNSCWLNWIHWNCYDLSFKMPNRLTVSQVCTPNDSDICISLFVFTNMFCDRFSEYFFSILPTVMFEHQSVTNIAPRLRVAPCFPIASFVVCFFNLWTFPLTNFLFLILSTILFIFHREKYSS